MGEWGRSLSGSTSLLIGVDRSLTTLSKAWNVKPKSASQKWRPSAEFVESALIFTYGSTNIFLEHLGSSSEGYSSQDLEHVSITVLFIGGGLASSPTHAWRGCLEPLG